MTPIVNGLAQDFAGTVEVLRLDAALDENVTLQSEYGVRGHPSFALLDGEGRVVQRFLGPQPEGVLREAMTAVEQGSEAIVPNLPSISELAGTPLAEIPPLPTLDADAIALGLEVYRNHCAGCHGERLEGEADWQTQNEDDSFRAPPHDASGHTWHHGDGLLIETIQLGGGRLSASIGGTSDMPAFGEVLTEKEILAVLSYIKSTWPEETRAIQWEQTVRENR